MRLLSICGMLAAGEYLASFAVQYSEVWPLMSACAVFVALFGYGLGVRCWGCLFALILGAALFFFASQKEVQRFRESPWMRGKENYCRKPPMAQARIVNAVKDDFSRRIGIGLEDDQAASSLIRAILLGERRCLASRTRQMFIESGTIHVFAISGLHVMVIAEVLALCLAIFLVPVRFAGLLATPLLWGYVQMIGFTPSAVRAAMMATIMNVAPVFWRKASGIRAWELTFLLVHLVSPRMITDVGNVLSFAVMLALVVVGDYAKPMARWRQTFLVTIAAWAVGVPIAAHVFGRVTPGGMVANLLLIATAKATVVSGALGVMTSCICDTAAVHVNNLCALCIKAMVLVADGVSRLPGANFETGRWPLLTCLEWYAVLALIGFLMWRRSERRRMLG